MAPPLFRREFSRKLCLLCVPTSTRIPRLGVLAQRYRRRFQVLTWACDVLGSTFGHDIALFFFRSSSCPEEYGILRDLALGHVIRST